MGEATERHGFEKEPPRVIFDFGDDKE